MISLCRSRGIAWIAVAGWVAAIFLLSAFTLEPITADFAPAGPSSVQTFRITNTSSQTIAIRIRVLSRTMDAEGRESNEPADSLFVVYPSRVTLGGGGVQLVRVQWKGNPAPTQELSFRLVVEQLPVTFEEGTPKGGAIRILTRYIGSLYVVPPHAAPDVILEQYEFVTDTAGKRGIQLLFYNRGTAHVLLNDLVIELSYRDRKVAFEGEILRGISGENMLAGARRRFFLPLGEEVEGFDYRNATISFRYEAVR